MGLAPHLVCLFSLAGKHAHCGVCGKGTDLNHVSHADEKGKWDELIEERGVRILIEPAALMHVIGTTMDFVEDRIKCALYPNSCRAAYPAPCPQHWHSIVLAISVSALPPFRFRQFFTCVSFAESALLLFTGRNLFSRTQTRRAAVVVARASRRSTGRGK